VYRVLLAAPGTVEVRPGPRVDPFLVRRAVRLPLLRGYDQTLHAHDSNGHARRSTPTPVLIMGKGATPATRVAPLPMIKRGGAGGGSSAAERH